MFDLRPFPRCSRSAMFRRGATTIEVAVVAPIFFLFVFGLIEYGRVQMISNMLKASCRSAARLGATESVSSAQVQTRVGAMMTSSVAAGDLTVVVKDASVWDDGGTVPQTDDEYDALPNIEVDDAGTRQLFLVRATVAYNDVAIVPLPLLQGVNLTGKAFMRHE